MGYIVAANPLGQMLFSPLVGLWSNKLGSVRIPVMLSLLLFTLSSAVYSSLELLSSHRKHWMLWTRFLVGVSSGNKTRKCTFWGVIHMHTEWNTIPIHTHYRKWFIFLYKMKSDTERKFEVKSECMNWNITNISHIVMFCFNAC